jgi:putative ABC transport system substrate-binding protein
MIKGIRQQAVGSRKKLRLGVCVFCAVLLAPGTRVDAQQRGKVVRIGYLQSGARQSVEAIQQELRELGYLEGKNIVFEDRDAKGKAERFSELAAELVRRNVHVIIAVNEAAARAAKNATQTIPIVMVRIGTNPVEAGLVESLARPGGNLTGVVILAVELTGKRLELFKEALPQLTRVDTLYDPTIRGNVQEAKHVQSTGRVLGLSSKSWEVRGAGDFEKVFALLMKDRPDALYVPGGPTLTPNRKLIADFALKTRLPSLHVNKDWVESGCLMSYGHDLADHYRRAAWYVDKILKGSKPADLPVEQPTKFELVINLKTANQIGVTVPQSILYRADRVIK